MPDIVIGWRHNDINYALLLFDNRVFFVLFCLIGFDLDCFLGSIGYGLDPVDDNCHFSC